MDQLLSQSRCWVGFSPHIRRCGAKVVAGGGHQDGVVQRTVLTNVSPGAQVSGGEVFGPACTVEEFVDLDEAIARANDTPFGVQAAIFTRSISTGLRAAHALSFGGVMVNEATEWRADEMPDGGVKGRVIPETGPRLRSEK
jgi:acyl-CoA reductase-like NAD-dependent aldehyde dehydrogenase